MQEVYSKRRQRLKLHMDDYRLDALLVQSPASRYYLSGFELHDPQCNESAGCLLLTLDEDHLLTDSRYLETGKILFPEGSIFVYTRDRFKQIREFISKAGVKKLGFDPQWMTCEFYWALQEELVLHPVKGIVEDMRQVKDEQEILALGKSCALNHQVFAGLRESIVPGMSEWEIAWEAEKMFREQGAQELSFPVIAAAGPNAALPHAVPGNTVLQENDHLLLDMGCRLDDYCSDQTRTLWMGDMEDSFYRRTRDLVRRAQDMVLEWMGPGRSVKEAYDRAVAFFAERGVEKHFTHSLGHGIGLETHESPSLGPSARGEFLPGMVVTVEPGLYYPGWGGVRWEYMVLVTGNGVEVL